MAFCGLLRLARNDEGWMNEKAVLIHRQQTLQRLIPQRRLQIGR
jgi:hypothetical protein